MTEEAGDEEFDGPLESLSGGWSYRLIRMDVSSPDEPWYEVHEVFYDDEGNPKLLTRDAVKVGGESPQTVADDLLLMAFDVNRQPALKESELATHLPAAHRDPRTRSR